MRRQNVIGCRGPIPLERVIKTSHEGTLGGAQNLLHFSLFTYGAEKVSSHGDQTDRADSSLLLLEGSALLDALLRRLRRVLEEAPRFARKGYEALILGLGSFLLDGQRFRRLDRNGLLAAFWVLSLNLFDIDHQ